MKEIPIDVPVECSDGGVGNSTNLIVHPTKLKVTHIVVLDTSFPPTERLVPVENILETTPDSIRLACTKHALANMERFIERHYVLSDQVESASQSMQPDATPVESGFIRIDEQRIPPGEMAVRGGTCVQATDGDVGLVGELLLDPDNGKITHLILLQGHIFGNTEISLPLSAIDHVSQDGLHLKLDKKTIQGLPAIPVKRTWKKVHSSDIELIVLVFNKVGGAEKALNAIRQYSQEYQFVILNSAVVVKNKKGKTSLKESADVDARHGALFGAITGGLIGLTSGAAGAVVGAAVGATTGGVTAHLSDMGFPNEELQALSDALKSGSSALLVLIEHKWVERTLTHIADLGADIWMQKVSDEIVTQFLKQDE